MLKEEGRRKKEERRRKNEEEKFSQFFPSHPLPLSLSSSSTIPPSPLWLTVAVKC
jgi:hypothetical protein